MVGEKKERKREGVREMETKGKSHRQRERVREGVREMKTKGKSHRHQCYDGFYVSPLALSYESYASTSNVVVDFM